VCGCAVISAEDIMTMAPVVETGFFAGAKAGKAGDKVLWAKNMTMAQIGNVG
jgi:hypothetical protein